MELTVMAFRTYYLIMDFILLSSCHESFSKKKKEKEKKEKQKEKGKRKK